MGVRPVTRHQLLRGDLGGSDPPLRPPWAVPEAVFVRKCSRCGECAGTCPEHIIRTGWAGYPEVSFAGGGCTFCGACGEACAEGAIVMDGGPPWVLRARVTGACLTFRGTICRSCGEECDAGAIRFTPRPGKAERPMISDESCTGCGACIAACPASAIEIEHSFDNVVKKGEP